jgi:DNA-binding transcriptional LysR family regulator
MAEGLKAMALEGHGIAFLPHSAVKKELRAKRLVSALPPNAKGLEITMDVRVYREKPSLKDLSRAGVAGGRGAASPKSSAQALWDYLLNQSARNK